MKKNQQNLRNLYDTIEKTNIKSSSRTEKEKKNIFEKIMTKNFQNLMKTMTMHIQEAQ